MTETMRFFEIQNTKHIYSIYRRSQTVKRTTVHAYEPESINNHLQTYV